MHLGAPPSRPKNWITTGLAVCFLALTATAVRAADSDAADRLKGQTDRWIDLERRTADERNDWQTQREVLATTIEVLKKDHVALQDRIDANNLAAGLFQRRLDAAHAELAEQEEAQAALGRRCATMEQQLRALLVRLPDPLKEKVGALLDKMDQPPDGTPPSISEKARALIAALTAIDLFNNTLTLTHHLRANGPNETLDVKVLYWGLAAGFGLDAKGERAWTLSPGATGWEWKEAPTHVAEIRTFIAVYEKQENPRLVVLPVGAEGGAQ